MVNSYTAGATFPIIIIGCVATAEINPRQMHQQIELLRHGYCKYYYYRTSQPLIGHANPENTLL